MLWTVIGSSLLALPEVFRRTAKSHRCYGIYLNDGFYSQVYFGKVITTRDGLTAPISAS